MFRRTLVQLTFLCAALPAAAQTYTPDGIPLGNSPPVPPVVQKLPDALLVKGAEPSASDAKTPLPEQGWVSKQNVYENRYFGLSYPLPAEWAESYKGPPPSEDGTYVLANVLPANLKGPVKGTILFTAQDMFFTYADADNAKELIAFRKEHLEEYYAVERPPSEVTVAGRTWARFDYQSEVAGIHWVILATQIRCHAVQFVFSGRDPQLLEKLVKDLDRMTLPAEAGAVSGKGGGDFPLCVADYARRENIVEGVEPELKDRRFNAIPVRIIIDKKGNVKHVHMISAFTDQAKPITDALLQWKFKPYVVDGKPVEVETGMIFGSSPRRKVPRLPATAVTAEKTQD
jgi:hypothetical protein